MAPYRGVSWQPFSLNEAERSPSSIPSETLGEGLPYENPVRLFKWLNEKGMTMLAGVKYERITDEGLVVTTKEGERKTLEADSIINDFALAARCWPSQQPGGQGD